MMIIIMMMMMMMMDEDENEVHCIVDTDMIELYLTSKGFVDDFKTTGMCLVTPLAMVT